MKLGKTAALSAAALLTAALWSDFAVARPGGHHRHAHHHHAHHHHGSRAAVFIAVPVFIPRYYYPSPYYYYPAPVYYSPPPPPVYIEQPQPQSQAYWYYCPAARAYYPHVQQCPGGWQRVVPQPPPG